MSTLAIDLCENGWIPDFLARFGKCIHVFFRRGLLFEKKLKFLANFQ